MTVEPLLQDLVSKFNDKVDNDEKLRKEIEGMDKRVLVDLESEKYSFHMHHQKINGHPGGRLSMRRVENVCRQAS